MKNKILFVLCLLFGLLFINGGLNKIFNYIPVSEDIPEYLVNIMNCFSETGWLMELVAVVEILGGILFILPKYRALGAIVILPIMVGILLTHLINAPDGIPMALILMAINIWVIVDNRDKYKPMIQ